MKLIVNFTPTGMIPTKEMTPYVPISINEIIEDEDARGVFLDYFFLHKPVNDIIYSRELNEDFFLELIMTGLRYISEARITRKDSPKDELDEQALIKVSSSFFRDSLVP